MLHLNFKLNSGISRKVGIIVSLLLLCLFFSFLTPQFRSTRNLINIVQQSAINGVIALGMTYVIITGGIDLSVGSIVALVGMLIAKMLVWGMIIEWALFIGLVIGLFCGFLNGLIIAKLRLQPFLVTLGTMSVYRGLTLIVSNGLPVRNLPMRFSLIMNAWNTTIPVPIVLFAGLTIVFSAVMKYTRYGQYIFALGGNEEATRLSGINVGIVKIITYSACGMVCAFGAVIFLGRLAAADPQAGNSYEMNAIASAAIGGASLAGGKGSIGGTIMGALILATLTNGLILLNVQSYYQTLAIGLIIILATVLDKYSNK
jgi:ribose transport system permease protein